MAKREPLPSRAEQEAFIRAYAGEPIPLSQLGPASLQRAYNYARGAQARGEPFDYGRATGHPPKIEHHHYESVQQKGLRIPMLDDWYIGTCERPPVLADVTRLLNHSQNRGVEHLYIAFAGWVVYEDGTRRHDATSNATDRTTLLTYIKESKTVLDLYDRLNPDTELDGTPPPIKIFCSVSMRPAIERGGLAKKAPPAPPPEARIKKLTRKQREEVVKKHQPKKPRYKLIEPGKPGKKPKYRYIPPEK